MKLIECPCGYEGMTDNEYEVASKELCVTKYHDGVPVGHRDEDTHLVITKCPECGLIYFQN